MAACLPQAVREIAEGTVVDQFARLGAPGALHWDKERHQYRRLAADRDPFDRWIGERGASGVGSNVQSLGLANDVVVEVDAPGQPAVLDDLTSGMPSAHDDRRRGASNVLPG